MTDVTMQFKWLQVSPDPHNVTMRNTLEPVDIIIEVGVPRTKENFANFLALSEHRELEIKAELNADIESAGKGPQPILTVEGMRYVISQLSGSNNTFEPELEEEEWDDVESTSDDEDGFGDNWDEEGENGTSNEDDNWDEDDWE